MAGMVLASIFTPRTAAGRELRNDTLVTGAATGMLTGVGTVLAGLGGVNITGKQALAAATGGALVGGGITLLGNALPADTAVSDLVGYSAVGGGILGAVTGSVLARSSGPVATRLGSAAVAALAGLAVGAAAGAGIGAIASMGLPADR